MRTFSTTVRDEEIQNLVAEWSELLAQKKFSEALAMFPFEGDWTPKLLEETIAGYGLPEPHPNGRRFEVTPLLGRPDCVEIVRKKIDVDRENLYGLNSREYVGMVHYDDIPLNGERSDLTASFQIRRVNADQLTLEFLDVHVL